MSGWPTKTGGACRASAAMTVLLLALICLLSGAPRAVSAEAGFEAANQLFEQGNFSEAAAGYQGLITNGTASVPILFNLGNALFKSGRFGEAIFYFRKAEMIAPRDPDVRANLQFARKEIAGAFAPAKSGWKRFFHVLSEREWALVTALAGTVWFLLLAVREGVASRRFALLWPIRVAAIAVVLFGICCALSHAAWSVADEAVVVAEKVRARYGPLEDSKTAFQMKSGEEVRLIGAKGDWVQVLDVTGRSGWVDESSVRRMSEPLL